jgi:RHS repeat-associated protein
VATPNASGVIQINWVHGNHLGVPILITDSAGNPATTPNDYLAPGFPGQSQVLSDLYYNRYRDYDPTTGRYIQADPIGLAGGPNDYAYVGGNPVNRTDPMGLDVWIEGPAPNEVAGHLSINVGNPLGQYKSYSFGIPSDAECLCGKVYQDLKPLGGIDPDYYRTTTSAEDAKIIRILDATLGVEDYYMPWRTCRSYSKNMYNLIAGLKIGRPGRPPNRPVPSGVPSSKPEGIGSTATD